MGYYAGCKIKIELPADNSAQEDPIRRAIAEKLPGIDLQFVLNPNAHRPTVTEAFVPHSHGMAAMKRQDFGGSEMKSVGPETLFGIASAVLDNFNMK
jgi:hypothetical protein